MKKFIKFLIPAVVVTGMLTGCAPQSTQSLNNYADLLRTENGVQNIEVSISTPLPFTVQGTLHVDFTGTPEELQNFYEKACTLDVNASARIEMTVQHGTTNVNYDNYRCDETPVNLADIAATYNKYDKGLQIALSQHSTSNEIYIGAEESIPFEDALTYAKIAQKYNQFSETTTVQVNKRLELTSPTEDQPKLLATLNSLNQQHTIESVEYFKTFLITLPSNAAEPERQAAETFMRTQSGGENTVVVIAGTGTVAVNTPPEYVSLQQQLQILDYITGTAANHFGVTASVHSYPELQTLISYVAANNPNNVPVKLQLVRNDLNRDEDFTTLSTNNYWNVNTTTNDYTEILLPKYEIMADSGVIGSVEFQDNLITARLKENLRTNNNAFSNAAEAMNEANKDGYFTGLWINGKEV